MSEIEVKECSNCGQASCKRDSWIKDKNGEPICWVAKQVATKLDVDKDRWDLLQWNAVHDVVRVATFGSKKYGDNNWKQGGGLDKLRLFAACMRHVYAWLGGQPDDPESGLPHLAHAAWNLLAILELDVKEKD
jgi:hypothetical protein